MSDATTYLDHAASTPVRPEARAALEAWLATTGNGSAPHAAGQAARRAVEEARERAATVLGVDPGDVVFTSGGTEADNLAVKGLAWAAAEDGRRHLVTTAVEHPAVRDTARWLAERQGFTLTEVPPRPDGVVDVERVLAVVTDATALVSVMAANNELGAVNDVATLAAPLRDRGVVLHSDTVQAVATRDPAALGVDALALSGHKVGAPQGVGLAVLRRGVPVVPLHHGGGQDRGVRSGTFASALDASLGAALVAGAADRDRLATTAARQTDRLADGLLALDGVVRHGPVDPAERLPTHLHVGIAGVDGEALTLALDRAHVHAASGAACGSGALKASHVLEACGIEADAVLRLTVGWTTTDDEVDHALDVLVDAVRRLRRGAAVAGQRA
jgi:cysteine desulfurase